MIKPETEMKLEGDRTIVISRMFDAAASIVFKAWTDPDLVRSWWAPRKLGVSMVSCEANPTFGGSYRYVIQNPDGQHIAFSGTYTEITPHSRIAYTQTLDSMAEAGEAQIVVTLKPFAEKTLLVSTETYASREVRDMALASGMEEGMRDTMEQLGTLVASLAKTQVD